MKLVSKDQAMNAVKRVQFSLRLNFVFLECRNLVAFLQRVSIACYAERCISYSKSVHLSVRPSVTRWH